MEEKVLLSFTRHEVFTLFNSLLVREKSPFVKQNKDWEVLLQRLWNESPDRTKDEALWNQNFRNLLDSWNISYQEDLERLDIPKVLEDDEEEE